jgi:hypothetical protein
MESRTQITRGYLKDCRKECEQNSFWGLDFASESSGGIVPLKCSKGDKSRKHLIKDKFRRENTYLSRKSH